MCDIFEKIEEYFENPGPGLVSSACSLCRSVSWDNLRDNQSGSHMMFLLEKRDVLSHSLKLLLGIGNQICPPKEVSLFPKEGCSWSSCLNLASHLY